MTKLYLAEKALRVLGIASVKSLWLILV